MDMGVDTGIFSEALHLSTVREPDRVLDAFERGLRRLGATHLFLSGLPLPRRSVTKLILRIVWPDGRTGGHLIDVANADPILAACLAAREPIVLRRGMVEAGGAVSATPAKAMTGSELLAAAGGTDIDLIAVPVHDMRPYQGCVMIAGPTLPQGQAAMAGLRHYCCTAFRMLVAVGRLDVSRPGDLSERERHVLQLTAIGKTAAEIADVLEISQRTVHAHLQNASDKMNASNKTHTVVEALRYGQICL